MQPERYYGPDSTNQFMKLGLFVEVHRLGSRRF